MKLLMLAKSSFKKNRSSSITLLILIITATLFLYIGLHVLSNLNGFLDQKQVSLNGADFETFVPDVYSEYISDVLSEMEQAKAYEQEEAIVYFIGSIRNKRVQEKAQSIGMILMNADANHDIQMLEIIDAGDTMNEDSIIVPYSLKATYGYRTGDKIETNFLNKVTTYTVYGFCEDIFFSSASNNSIYKCYVPDQAFQSISASTDPVSKYTCHKLLLKEGISSQDFEGDFVKKASESKEYNSGTTMNFNIEAYKIGAITTINILMIVLVSFALLVVVISMVVIRFTIITHIEEDMKNIGSMEAIGFTNRMIRNSLVFEFLIITIIGFLVGILLSFAISGAITTVISSSIGLNWQMKPGMLSMFISFAAITLMILIITMKVTGRIAKITPVIALRSGIDNYHFGRNHFPLAKCKGPLQLLLGFKQIFNNKKQSISIGIIGTLMSFILVFSMSMYHSFVQDEHAFFKLVGIERSDLAVASYDENYLTVYDIAAATAGVKETLRLTNDTLTVCFGDKETSTNTYVCNDYDKLTVSTIIEGRYPKHDNEIVLSTVNRERLGVEIGDMVSLESGNGSCDFMVVGISQHINSLGKSISITESGMLRCNSAFFPKTLYLYLEEGVSADATIKLLENNLKDYNISVVNMEDALNTALASVTQSITLICITIGVITAFIIVLLLYYLLKVKIIREKKLIGINKAVGFTTGQLIWQNNISFGTVLLLSTLLGSVLSVCLINPLFSLMLSAVGIKNGNFATPPSLMGISVILMELLALITTTLVSIRIRKVNPRELMAE